MSRGRSNSLVSSVPTDRPSQIGQVLKVAGKKPVSNWTSHFSSHVKFIPVSEVVLHEGVVQNLLPFDTRV